MEALRTEACYGPYKQDSTGQKGPRRIVSQCAGCGTDGTSGTIGRGVAESRSHAHTKCTYVLIYSHTDRKSVV